MSNSVKGEEVMLYTGNTLADAFSKALGRPIGQKAKTFGAYGSKPDGFGKQDEIITRSDQLNQHRAQAIARAEQYLRTVDTSFRSREYGYAELFLLDEQRVVPLEDLEAGHPVQSSDGIPKFKYDFPEYAGHPYFVLVFGHSHPSRSRNPSLSERRELSNLSRPGPGNPDGDTNLLRYAPVVIGYPFGNTRVHGRIRSFIQANN